MAQLVGMHLAGGRQDDAISRLRESSFLEGTMKKTAKRGQLKSSLRRSGTKSRTARSTKPSKSSKPSQPKEKPSSGVRSKVKQVAKKAASAAIVAGGMAAIGTALEELNPGKREPEGAASDKSGRTDEGKSTG